MIRIAAVGDLHYGAGSTDILRPSLDRLPERADLLLLAGDLTRCGGTDEISVLADDLRRARLPVVAVLGNHDYQSNMEDDVRRVLEDAGVTVLEGEAVTLEINGRTVGVAGTKGFGGGFRGAHGTDFGEPEMKAFVGHTKMLADRLEQALNSLRADFRVALLHYSPIETTLEGERLEIYPFLGSYLLAQAIDNAGADLVFHGHAHHGTEKGRTPAGIPVRNVAQPVIRHAYNVYTLGTAPSAVVHPSKEAPAALRTGTGSSA
ncbi:MAG: metallophosphoesterase [Chloroflexi bacterium]|nr:MAG: metallophosphoesterase [Chloroflexota bacterium]TME47527.1 MAG: metallophosphoesterase [Chloroflexota bacterium]